MHVGIEILQALLVALNLLSEPSLVLDVARQVTLAVLLGEDAIAVDIHVGELAALALDVQNAIALQMITAVRKALAVSHGVTRSF